MGRIFRQLKLIETIQQKFSHLSCLKLPLGFFLVLFEKSHIQNNCNLGQSQLSIFLVTENITLSPNFQFVLQKISEKLYNIDLSNTSLPKGGTQHSIDDIVFIW